MEQAVSELFSLRPAREDDIPYINSYSYAEGMDNPPFDGGITVAVNDEDIPVGFIRIAESPVEENGAVRPIAHINPVVTTKQWRGFGVGRALVENAQREYGELRLIARGHNIPFYRLLGFKDASWAAISADVNDCDGCEMREECNPLPMVCYP